MTLDVGYLLRQYARHCLRRYATTPVEGHVPGPNCVTWQAARRSSCRAGPGPALAWAGREGGAGGANQGERSAQGGGQTHQTRQHLRGGLAAGKEGKRR